MALFHTSNSYAIKQDYHQGINGDIPFIADSVDKPNNSDPRKTVAAVSGVVSDDCNKSAGDNKSSGQEYDMIEVEDGEVAGEVFEELDEELLDVLGEEVPASSSQVKINEKLRKWWKGWMEEGLSEEVRKDLLKKYPRDGELITEAPKVNLEVQRHLTDIAKKRDEHFMQTQSCIGTAISSLSGAVSMLTEPSTEPVDQTLLLKHLWDTGKILSDVFHQQSNARKSFITPTLDKDLKPTLDASISDEWLYGQKLSEQVKEAKAIVKVAATLKTSDRPVAKRSAHKNFVQGNVRGLPVRPRQVGTYFPRRVTSVNYRYRAPATSSRVVQRTSTEKSQTSRKK